MAWGDRNDDHLGPWGRPPSGDGGNQPPPPGGPDLDEMLQRARRHFMQFTPGGNEGSKGITLAVIIIALLWLSSGIYFVKPDEQGVVLRFGKYSYTTAPGLNYHLPYPIETVFTPRVTTVNHVEIGYRSGGYYRGEKNNETAVSEESLMLTGDENIVDIDFEVQWKISSAPDFLFNIRDPEDTVKAVSESAMREVIGKSQIATVLAEGKLQVEQDTKKLLQDTLNGYKAGIEIVTVNLLKADPPAEVLDAQRDVQTALADAETTRNQAEAYHNDIVPRARGDAQKMILDAQAYKEAEIARAQGDAARFTAIYDQYKQDKDVTRKRMYIEMMEDVLPGVNKVILENKQGVVPYLPLSAIKEKSEESPK